jgi:hypothetical protein
VACKQGSRNSRASGAFRGHVYDGEPWSEMDLWDLKNSLAHGESIEEVAEFLCRSGTLDEVRRKAEELGLHYRSERRPLPTR